MTQDERWMAEALKEAQLALKEGETPVGAVIVAGGRVVGRGHNQPERLKDATAHAEMIAISAASVALGNWRLLNATVYVTVEPCVMCASALALARVKRLVFGAFDEKFGGCGSLYDIVRDGRMNHVIEVKAGVRAGEAAVLLREFFARMRKTEDLRPETQRFEGEKGRKERNGAKCR